MTDVDYIFIRYLERLYSENQRGALANLRRGLGKPPGTESLTFPHVIPYLPEGLSKQQEQPYFLIASLFALHPMSVPNGNFGSHCADLGRARGGENGKPPPNVERRFIALLATPPQSLYRALQPLVNLLKSENIPVCWVRLLKDIQSWNYADGRANVRRAWAREFWKHSSPQIETESTTDFSAKGD